MRSTARTSPLEALALRTRSAALRASPLVLALAPILALSSPARAQDEGLAQRPLRVTRRFAAGETWTTCTAARVRVMPVDGAPREQSIACTQSILVLSRPARFALQATLTSGIRRERSPGAASLGLWWLGEPAPWRASADPRAPEWTYELDAAWGLGRVTGPDAPFEWLVAPFSRDLGRADLVPECLPGRLVDPRVSLLEGLLTSAWDLIGAPVNDVMLALGRGEAIEPGRVRTIRPREWWPGAQVRYLGLDGAGGHFRAVWDDHPDHALAATFVIDAAGRLVWLHLRDEHAWGDGPWAVRAVRDLEHVLVRARPPAWPTSPVAPAGRSM